MKLIPFWVFLPQLFNLFILLTKEQGQKKYDTVRNTDRKTKWRHEWIRLTRALTPEKNATTIVEKLWSLGVWHLETERVGLVWSKRWRGSWMSREGDQWPQRLCQYMYMFKKIYTCLCVHVFFSIHVYVETFLSLCVGSKVRRGHVKILQAWNKSP